MICLLAAFFAPLRAPVARRAGLICGNVAVGGNPVRVTAAAALIALAAPTLGVASGMA